LKREEGGGGKKKRKPKKDSGDWPYRILERKGNTRKNLGNSGIGGKKIQKRKRGEGKKRSSAWRAKKSRCFYEIAPREEK